MDPFEMTQLLSPDTFQFFANYLLAGYVVIIIRSRFVSGLRPKPAELILEAIIFSLVNQFAVELIRDISAFTGITGWLGSTGMLLAYGSNIYLVGKILLLPALIGAFLGYTLSAGWKNALLRRLSLPVIHPVQRGYDFAFGNNREPCFVIVTYFDGTSIAGYFGNESLAASDANRSDLYLERLYLVEDGAWKDPNPSRSGYLSLENVRTIEFMDAERTEHGGTRKNISG